VEVLGLYGMYDAGSWKLHSYLKDYWNQILIFSKVNSSDQEFVSSAVQA